MARNGKSKSNGHGSHHELAQTIAREYAGMLEASLERIGNAVEEEERNASFTATVAFRHTKHGLVAKLEPRERIPLPALEFRLSQDGNQLSLFSGPHAAGEVQDMEQPEA